MIYPEIFPYSAEWDIGADYSWRNNCRHCNNSTKPMLEFNIVIYNRSTLRNIGSFCQAECAKRFFWPHYCLHRLKGDLMSFTEL